jgi:hypothetical protein
MIENILAIIFLLFIGAFIGVGILFAVLYLSWEKD